MTAPRRPTGGEPRRRTTGIHPVIGELPYDQQMSGAALSTTTLGPRSRTTRQLEAIPEPARRRAAWFLPTLAMGALTVAAFVYLMPSSVAHFPARVQGAWVANDTAYAGARLVISASSVQQFSGAVAVGPAARLLEIRVTERSDTLAIVARHEVDGGGSAELVMAYVAGEREVVMLRNPSGVQWYRSLSPVTLPKE